MEDLPKRSAHGSSTVLTKAQHFRSSYTAILLLIIELHHSVLHDHLMDVAEKPPPKGGKSHDQCWYLENPIFVLLQQH